MFEITRAFPRFVLEKSKTTVTFMEQNQTGENPADQEQSCYSALLAATAELRYNRNRKKGEPC